LQIIQASSIIGLILCAVSYGILIASVAEYYALRDLFIVPTYFLIFGVFFPMIGVFSIISVEGKRIGGGILVVVGILNIIILLLTITNVILPPTSSAFQYVFGVIWVIIFLLLGNILYLMSGIFTMWRKEAS
jgi:hypothetical protein